MTSPDTALGRLLRSIPDPDRRAQLAQWVAEYEVSPHDPALSMVHLTLLSDQWADERLAQQRRATEAATRRIDAETAKALTRISHQTAGATTAATHALHEALAELTTQVSIGMEQQIEQSIRRAESGGTWGWAVAVTSSVITGLLVTLLFVAYPAITDRLRGMDPTESEALALGEDLLARWRRLTAEQQSTVAENLGWSLVPQDTPIRNQKSPENTDNQ